MIDPLLLAWILAQAATAPSASSALVALAAAASAILSSGATAAAIKAYESIAKQRAVNERATTAANRAIGLEEQRTRRAHEEEVTGRIEIESPIAERFAVAEREERRELSELVRKLDSEIAARTEQIGVLKAERERDLAEVARLSRLAEEQAEEIIRLHREISERDAHQERVLDWIEKNLPDAGPPPRRAASASTEVRIQVAKRDPRRE